jgi:hypothetical protein
MASGRPLGANPCDGQNDVNKRHREQILASPGHFKIKTNKSHNLKTNLAKLKPTIAQDNLLLALLALLLFVLLLFANMQMTFCFSRINCKVHKSCISKYWLLGAKRNIQYSKSCCYGWCCCCSRRRFCCW